MPIPNHVGAEHCTCIEDDTATPQQASLVLEVLMSRTVTNKGRDRRINAVFAAGMCAHLTQLARLSGHASLGLTLDFISMMFGS